MLCWQWMVGRYTALMAGIHLRTFVPVVCVQEKSWVDETLIIQWICNCYQLFTPATCVDYRQLPWSPKWQSKEEATQAIVQSCCKAVLQHPNISVNRSFKKLIQTVWINNMRDEGKKEQYWKTHVNWPTLKTADSTLDCCWPFHSTSYCCCYSK